jgi:hypothetical protein
MNVLKSVFVASGLMVAQGLWAQDASVSGTTSSPPAATTQPTAQGLTSPATAAPKAYTVPSGTKVLLSLKSAVNTKTAKPGDGVYLVSTFPVVVGSRVVIPPGVYVQGIVDRVQRPGRVKGRAQVGMHFTSMIFPNGSVVEIPGVVNGLPGSSGPKVKDEEGTVEQSGNKGKDAATAAGTAMEGAAIGSIAGGANGSPGTGALYGGLAGAAVGGLVTLFTRGDDINIEQGTTVEMVLQRPLMVEDANLEGNGAGLAQPGPAAGQPHPMEKPKRRTNILCPLGALGCN